MSVTAYFLKHPVIALIFNAMVIIVGFLSLASLSIREYPEVHFPQVQISTHYPNASPEVVENSITSPLENQLAGVEGLETITSDSNQGISRIYLTFKNGVSMDQSLIAIREAIGLVELPVDVSSPIVARKTTSDDMPFIVISLESPYTDLAELTHYANLNFKNAFSSIQGVAFAEIWGQPYTYNIILDSRKMYTFGVNADEVLEALQKRTRSLPVGKFQNKISVTLNSELKTIQDYENLVIKERIALNHKIKQGEVFLKQIADVKLQPSDQQFRARINGKRALCIAIYKLNAANPVEVSELVHKQLQEAKEFIPQGLEMNIISDQADFIKSSLKKVKSSICEAIICVLIIVFLFFRNIKATIIPLIAIPISLVGSFVFLKIFGFSINIMTLLAIVLAIGLVVDDAIIVLENIQRHIEKGALPFNAAMLGAKEISSAIVAMTLTLASVYAPLAFIKGTIGDLFIEFAVTLASSVLVSGIVSLTLSPLMCVKTLRKHHVSLWPKIDELLNTLTLNYKNILNRFFFYKKTCGGIFFASLCLIVLFLQILSSEIVPKEDRNLIGVYIPPLPGEDVNAIEQKVIVVEEQIKSVTEAKHDLTLIGEWGGSIILPLKPQSSRKRSAQEIVDSIKPVIMQIPSLVAYPWSSSSGLPGMEDFGSAGELSLVISTTESYANLFKVVENIRKSLENHKVFEGVRHNLQLDTMRYRIDLNNNEMAYLNISPQQIAKTVEVFFSGNQSLSFSKDGILYPIILKGKQSPWNLESLYITNKLGQRISLGVVSTIILTSGPNRLYHYNQMRSVVLSTDLPRNESFGSAMKEFFNQVSKELPSTYRKIWFGNAQSFGESKRTMATLFCLAILFIYAILSVQFENFIDPGIILLTVPLACLGGISFIWVVGGSINIYSQIGFITLIGLITKHGILIVEFANQLQKEMSLKESIIQASSLRLRPILMTTGAMVVGAIPLILSTEEGHEAQQAIGIVLVGGLT